jgi:hypothetical protein
MPHYYLNIRNGNGLTVDEEGQELADAAEARETALVGIRSILAEELASGRMDLDGSIDVLDAASQLVMSVRFEEAVAFHFRRQTAH